MAYLIFIILALALLVGFVFVTRYEVSHAGRFFEKSRARFDARIEHALFILAHVDLSAFIREEVLRMSRYFGHATAHLSLQLVRAAERLLTRTVRRLRTHAPPVTPGESTRPFLKTLSEFKETLKATPSDTEQF